MMNGKEEWIFMGTKLIFKKKKQGLRMLFFQGLKVRGFGCRG